MNSPDDQRYKSAPASVGWMLSVCIIFLQVGFTYYWSFQTLAVLLVMAIVLKSRPVFLNLGFVFLSILVFFTFLALTALTLPSAISQNSENLFYTFIGVVGYAAMMVSMPNFAFRSPEVVLRFFGFVSTVTILTIVGLICVTDLEIFPLLTRQTLILQNTTLITNYTTLEVLSDDFAYLQNAGLKPVLDLFYGEQSFLALVIFASITSRIVCDKLLNKMGGRKGGQVISHVSGGMLSFVKHHAQIFVIVLGLGAMIYIQSFSSFFYVAIVLVALFFSTRRRIVDVKVTPMSLVVMILALVLLGKTAWMNYEYYAHRFSTISDSVSFEQRFSGIFDLDFQEYILGISDIAKLPEVGFHNGVLYIIAISGFGGIALMTFLFYRIHALSRPLGVALLVLGCVFGVFSQNGGIFSPNKLVILSLVLIPLACVNGIGRRKLALKSRSLTAKTDANGH